MSGPRGILSIAPETLASMQQPPSLETQITDEVAVMQRDLILMDAHGERFVVTEVHRDLRDPTNVRFSVSPVIVSLTASSGHPSESGWVHIPDEFSEPSYNAHEVPLTAVRQDMRALMEAAMDVLFPPSDVDGVFDPDRLRATRDEQTDFSRRLRGIIDNALDKWRKGGEDK